MEGNPREPEGVDVDELSELTFSEFAGILTKSAPATAPCSGAPVKWLQRVSV